MYFGTKSYLKSNHYHTSKHPRLTKSTSWYIPCYHYRLTTSWLGIILLLGLGSGGPSHYIKKIIINKLIFSFSFKIFIPVNGPAPLQKSQSLFLKANILKKL